MSSWGELNDYADKEDFASTVLGVRGGPDPDRWQYWHAALEALPDDLDLSEEEGAVAEWPTTKVAISKSGYLYDTEDNDWIRCSDLPAGELKTDAEGWVRVKEVWTPPAPEKPAKRGRRHPGSGWYVEQHPTHFDWEPQIKALVDRLKAEYDVFINTYVDHPPGWGRDATSFDVWHMDGRGVSVPYDIGQAVFDAIFNDLNPPWIEWCIWQGWIWDDYNGWRRYWDYDVASDAQHINHAHFTFHSTL